MKLSKPAADGPALTQSPTMHDPTPAHLPGWHLLLDLYGARHLTDAARLGAILTAAAKAAGALVIHAHVHAFPGRAGVTGVVLLAESHISIHTWPELGLAAVDIFMCGAADVDAARLYIETALTPTRVHATKLERGRS